MKNVKKGKIDSNNVSVLKRTIAKFKALLMSPKTLETMDKSVLKEPVEVLYSNQPLVNTGHLSEERPIIESLPAESIPSETPLVQGSDSNIFIKAANAIAGFHTNENTPVENETPMIVPPFSNTPNVFIKESEPAQIETLNSYDVSPFSQPIDEGYRAHDSVEAAIKAQIVSPKEPRREVIEQPLQTPQEFEVHDNIRLQSNTAVVIERWREEFKKIVETEKNNQLKAVEDSSKKLMDAIDKGLNEISRANDASVEQKKADMQAIRNVVINQNPYEQQDYGNGIYGR